MTTGGRSTPWTGIDRAVWAAGLAVAAIVWAWAWWQAAGTAQLSHQMPWASGAVGALLLATMANGTWLLRARRRIGLRRLALLADDAGIADDRPADAGRPGGPLVAAPGLRRYHRPDCPLARGAEFTAAAQAAHETAGRMPCGVCRP